MQQDNNKTKSTDDHEALECIDLNEASNRKDSLTDTISIKTEFEDPDSRGRSRRRDVDNHVGSDGGVMMTISSIGHGITNTATRSLRGIRKRSSPTGQLS